MALPIALILWGIFAAGGAVATLLFLEDLINFFKGKNLAILGEIETGKTTLHSFLREGKLTTVHEATTRKVVVPKNNFELEDQELILKKGIDVSGQKDYMKDWKDIFIKSDYCFYMFNAHKVYNDNQNHIKNINYHLTHINNWKIDNGVKSQIILIGTFADEISEFKNLNKSNVQEFEQKIREKIKKAYLKVNLTPSNIFIGSLKDKKSIESLLKDILIRLKNL